MNQAKRKHETARNGALPSQAPCAPACASAGSNSLRADREPNRIVTLELHRPCVLPYDRTYRSVTKHFVVCPGSKRLSKVIVGLPGVVELEQPPVLQVAAPEAGRLPAVREPHVLRATGGLDRYHCRALAVHHALCRPMVSLSLFRRCCSRRPKLLAYRTQRSRSLAD